MGNGDKLPAQGVDQTPLTINMSGPEAKVDPKAKVNNPGKRVNCRRRRRAGRYAERLGKPIKTSKGNVLNKTSRSVLYRNTVKAQSQQ